ncbi:MAG: hypothetical protein Q7U60_02570 [Candidatus Methanoperedens sp.]|nr:hypothetical protein [Candidatus Methanoperedens sp.]
MFQKAFWKRYPVTLRRVGVRVANLVGEKGQRTLGEFENGNKKR